MTTLLPDPDTTIEFLRLIYPEGPWMLTAISVDKKSIRTSTFFPSTTGEMVGWLERHGQFNLYYSVNQATEIARERVKLYKHDVDLVHFLHVDADPRAGEDVDAEQARILESLRSYKIEPTVIVFSGGGFNALWKLREPIRVARGAIDEEQAVERAIDVERRNWQLELDFGADNCRDVSRILRLPGTINRPDVKKRAKGRVEALATIVHRSEHVYVLSQFGATPVVSTNTSSNQSTKVSQDVRRIESVDELDKWDVPERLKIIVAQGHDPEKFDGDRSKPLYFTVCELVRGGVPDEIILGIITDPKWGISESVLDKGNNVTRYALRQLQQAKDFAEDPRLAKMNEEFAVILGYGSSTVVMVERGHWNVQSERWEPVFQTFRSFRDRIKSFSDIEFVVNEKPKTISAFDWWTRHKRRREYVGVGFEPGLHLEDHYNLWTGFSVQPKPGDGHERLMEHVFEQICDGRQEYFDYLIRWMARTVQTPRTQSMVAPVLLSRELGVGKSVFTDFFGEIFDPHRYVASDVSELTGKFNAHLSSCLLVVAEEAFDLRDKRHESVLKERITGRMIGIERKGVDRILVPNYIHLIMTSNKDRVVPASDHERRFFVLRVNPRKKQNSDYFLPIIRDAARGGVANLLHHLMEVDVSDFDVTNFPRTEALREQQEHNLALETQWLFEKLEIGSWGVPGFTSWIEPIPKPLLYEDYRSTMSEMNVRFIRGKRAFHNFVTSELPGTRDKQIYWQDTRPMAFLFPTLEECRRIFDENRGWSTEWREPLAVQDGKVLNIKDGRPFE